MTSRLVHVLFCACVVSSAAPAAEPAKKPASKPSAERAADMDYGPFLSTSVVRPAGKPYKPTTPENPNGPKFPVDGIPDPVVLKGVVQRFTAHGLTATMAFDTDALCWRAGWTGGWLDLSGTMLTNHKGISYVTVDGTERFVCNSIGWGSGKTGDDFTDPRKPAMGPLPEEQARYDGLYLNGNDVVLSYRIGGTRVLEMAGFEAQPAGEWAFTRTVSIAAHDAPRTMAIYSVARAKPVIDKASAVLTAGETATAVYVVNMPADARLHVDDGHLHLALPTSKDSTLLKVLIWSGKADESTAFMSRGKASPAPVDPATLCKGGPARWKPVVTQGQPGRPAKPDAAYVADTLTLPDDNPSKSWLRLSGLGFFSDGRAVVSTLNGDVWVASGIDDSLAQLTWTRFATGLYHPMGLCVVDDKVYVRGRDQITRLHDLNGDGEADFYENFNNEGMAHPSYHGFVFDLQTDDAGNFYYARGGIGMATDLPGQGRLVRVSKDGRTATVIGTGLRAPNGLGVGGGGAYVTVSDNQGNWIPSSKIHAVDPSKPAEFLGFLPHHHMDKPPASHSPAMLWIPHKLDNSSGGQVAVRTDKWGPYQGQLVHSSFGAAALMLLLPDTGPASAQAKVPQQAAIVRLPLDFPTGIMRPAFNPRDGQLYLAGVGGGWQTKGTRDGGLYRVRYTGQPAHLPCGFAVVPNGIRLTFPEPLDRAAATDAQNWGGEQWNYVWSEKYGSPEFSAKDPKKVGRDEVEIQSVTLSEDGRTATLHIKDLKPVMQMQLQYNLKSAKGTAVEDELYLTINAVPGK